MFHRNSPWPEERIARLRELAGQGLSYQEIADELGCGLTRSAVGGMLNRQGISNGRERKGGRPGPGRKQVPSSPKPLLPELAPEVAAMDIHPPPVVDPQSAMPAPRKRPLARYGPRTILHLRSDTCRWPLWDFGAFPDPDTARYCGDRCSIKIEGVSETYCDLHMRAAEWHRW